MQKIIYTEILRFKKIFHNKVHEIVKSPEKHNFKLIKTYDIFFFSVLNNLKPINNIFIKKSIR